MIVIAGFGFVGKAHYDTFKQHYELIVVDPSHNENKIDALEDIKGVICCVSTPAKRGGGCDMSNVINVLSKTPNSAPVLIKSTIDLKGWKKVQREFPDHSITFSPEFLRAVSATTDLQETKQFILAGENVIFWRNFYKTRNKKSKFLLMSVEEAILAKYFRNAFLATKVSFFNEVYDLCNEYDVDFDSVRQGITDDTRIGPSHSFVEPSYARGWGGMCFPKDTKALLKIANDKKINLNTIDAAVEYNKTIRKKT
jgi:UDPglucose 6-dehydrogenase